MTTMTTTTHQPTNDFDLLTTIYALKFGVAALRTCSPSNNIDPDTLRFFVEATGDLLKHTLNWAQFGTEHPEHLRELRKELSATIDGTCRDIASERPAEGKLVNRLETVAIALEVYAELLYGESGEMTGAHVLELVEELETLTAQLGAVAF